jgi:3-isopropylmalate/(R)-2-methylmalate dehydratase small subunit
VDLKQSLVRDLTKKEEFRVGAIPDVMLAILQEGGIVEFVRKHGDLVFQ